jgi:hypothetical protein
MARDILRRTLEAQRGALGGDHPDTRRTADALAGLETARREEPPVTATPD